MSVKDDYASYMMRMMDGDSSGALAIEKRYGLDGYPPEVVSLWLWSEVEKPGSGFDAIDEHLAH